jgi:hypothetical protein
MGKLFDLNVTKAEKGKFSSNLGTAHEFLVTGLLMRLGFDVSVSSVKGGPYDLLITAFNNEKKLRKFVIKAQVKTISKGGSIKFIGGVRGGKDRAFTSATKKLVDKSYKYSEKVNDLIIGVEPATCDLYLIPTKFLRSFGKSKSKNKLSALKNNWDLLLNWREDYLTSLYNKVKD